jgi:hypothetical protein
MTTPHRQHPDATAAAPTESRIKPGPPPPPTICAVCSNPGGESGHLLPLCLDCFNLWVVSPERAEAATARERFANRVRRAHGLPDVVLP